MTISRDVGSPLDPLDARGEGRPVPNAPPVSSGLATLAGRAFAAVLFDMDGTLIDSTPSVERSWASWAGMYGIDPADLKGWHGVPSRGLIAHFLPAGVRAEAEKRITDLEIADVVGIAILPGAAEALRALAPSGRSAIATSCSDRLAAARLGATGIAAPQVVVTASDVVHGKPAPDPYLLAAERLGVDPGACLVVEDAPAGLAAAKAAGCATLALTTTTPYADLIADPNVDAIVPTLAYVRFEVTDAGVRLIPAGPDPGVVDR